MVDIATDTSLFPRLVHILSLHLGLQNILQKKYHLILFVQNNHHLSKLLFTRPPSFPGFRFLGEKMTAVLNSSHDRYVSFWIQEQQDRSPVSKSKCSSSYGSSLSINALRAQ